MLDIVILTDHRYVNPEKADWYTQQVLDEDRLLQTALENKGLTVCKKDWADKNFDWTSSKYAIFRTTWDYFERFDEFFIWLEDTKKKTTFINSSEIINWNIDKHYLQDLAKNKVNIAPTLFVEKGDRITLAQLFDKANWKEAVLKPAISGAARQTYRIHPNNCSEFETLFQKLIENESMLFQEFLNNIITQGEISLILIGGKYTHAVKKIAKKGDFRVQDDHGGRVEKYTPTKEEILFVEKEKTITIYEADDRIEKIYTRTLRKYFFQEDTSKLDLNEEMGFKTKVNIAINFFLVAILIFW